MELSYLFLRHLLSYIIVADVFLFVSAIPIGEWQRIDDMILSPIQTKGLYTVLSGKNAQINIAFRWKNATVPYEFDAEYTQSERNEILNILKRQYAKTCVQFRPREESDEDYVQVVNEQGCWSYVGRVGKMQKLSLQRNSIYKPNCINDRNIAHEFLHALGLFHQHCVSSRDDYITIQWDNIIPSRIGNFVKYGPNKIIDFDQPYDFDSIMHYSETAISVNGKPTIIAKNPTVKFGHANTLSAIDIIKVNKMYNCTTEQILNKSR